MNLCLKCGKPIADNDDFCVFCGTPKIVVKDNYCINKNCPRYKRSDLVTIDQQFCGKCGSLTIFGNVIQEFV